MKKGSSIVVLGGRESGVGAALLARDKGFEPYVSDSHELKPCYREQLLDAQIPVEEGEHHRERLEGTSLVIKSPGIPQEAPPVQWAREKGIPLISEVEWAYRYCPGKVLAVTGTNGKTTVSLLLHHILLQAGYSVTLAGNIGASFAAAVRQDPTDYYVVETSSFQLDDIRDFQPYIAVLTNITPDHLERYGGRLEAYAAAKFRIAENQSSQDHFIYSDDDPFIRRYWPAKMQAQTWPISLKTKTGAPGGYLNADSQLVINIQDQDPMTIEELALQGKHNQAKSMDAGLATRLLSIRKDVIRESLAGFENVEHRLEPAFQIYDIAFINDSKATNVNSTWYALENMQKPVIWIAGGVDKGNDYSQLHALVQQKVKALVCLGKDNAKLFHEFGDKVGSITETQDMNEAVQLAYRLGDKGDVVLLSPVCASFDLFEDYEDRGRQFKEAVRRL